MLGPYDIHDAQEIQHGIHYANMLLGGILPRIGNGPLGAQVLTDAIVDVLQS